MPTQDRIAIVDVAYFWPDDKNALWFSVNFSLMWLVDEDPTKSPDFSNVSPDAFLRAVAPWRWGDNVNRRVELALFGGGAKPLVHFSVPVLPDTLPGASVKTLIKAIDGTDKDKGNARELLNTYLDDATKSKIDKVPARFLFQKNAQDVITPYMKPMAQAAIDETYDPNQPPKPHFSQMLGHLSTSPALVPQALNLSLIVKIDLSIAKLPDELKTFLKSDFAVKPELKAIKADLQKYLSANNDDEFKKSALTLFHEQGWTIACGFTDAATPRDDWPAFETTTSGKFGADASATTPLVEVRYKEPADDSQSATAIPNSKRISYSNLTPFKPIPGEEIIGCVNTVTQLIENVPKFACNEDWRAEFATRISPAFDPAEYLLRVAEMRALSPTPLADAASDRLWLTGNANGMVRDFIREFFVALTDTVNFGTRGWIPYDKPSAWSPLAQDVVDRVALKKEEFDGKRVAIRKALRTVNVGAAIPFRLKPAPVSTTDDKNADTKATLPPDDATDPWAASPVAGDPAFAWRKFLSYQLIDLDVDTVFILDAAPPVPPPPVPPFLTYNTWDRETLREACERLRRIKNALADESRAIDVILKMWEYRLKPLLGDESWATFAATARDVLKGVQISRRLLRDNAETVWRRLLKNVPTSGSFETEVIDYITKPVPSADDPAVDERTFSLKLTKPPDGFSKDILNANRNDQFLGMIFADAVPGNVDDALSSRAAPDPMVFQILTDDSLAKHELLHRKFTGVGFLMRRIEGTKERAWCCLNMGSIDVINDGDLGELLKKCTTERERNKVLQDAWKTKKFTTNVFPSTVIPKRFTTSGDGDGELSNVTVSYDNQALTARSPLANYANLPATASPVLEPERKFRIEHGPVNEADEWSKLPALLFGYSYEVLPFVISNAGILPQLIAMQERPEKLDLNTIAKNESILKAAAFKIDSYKRRYPVGAPRLSGVLKFVEKKWLPFIDQPDGGELAVAHALPAIPSDVIPLASELMTSDDDPQTEPDAKWKGTRAPILLLSPDGTSNGKSTRGIPDRFALKVRPPSVDLQTWDRWYLGDVIADERFGRKANDRAAVFVAYHNIAMRRFEKDTKMLDGSLDDPACDGTCTVILKRMYPPDGALLFGKGATFAAKKLASKYIPTVPGGPIQDTTNDSDFIALAQLEALTIEVAVADRDPDKKDRDKPASVVLAGSTYEIRIPPGEVWKVSIHCNVDKGDGAKFPSLAYENRFNKGARDVMSYLDNKPLSQPLEFVVEAVPRLKEIVDAARKRLLTKPCPDGVGYKQYVFAEPGYFMGDDIRLTEDKNIHSASPILLRKYPDPDDLWARMDAHLEAQNVVLSLHVPNPMVNPLFAYVASIDVQRQLWRWGGQPLDPFPFQTRENGVLVNWPKDKGVRYDEFSDVPLDPLKRETSPDDLNTAFMRWEATAMSDRADDDYALSVKTLPFNNSLDPQLTTNVYRLFSQDISSDPRAMYYRFAVRARSRYPGLIAGWTDDVESRFVFPSGNDADFNTKWRRLYVPGKWSAEVAKPVIHMVVPLTRAVNTSKRVFDKDCKSLPTSGVLVVLSEPWFEKAGVVEEFKAELEVSYYDPEAMKPGESEDDYRKRLQGAQDIPENQFAEFGPDPIVTANPFTGKKAAEAKKLDENPQPFESANILEEKAEPKNPDDTTEKKKRLFIQDAFNCDGPLGHTFDTLALAPRVVSSSFFLEVNSSKLATKCSSDKDLLDLDWYLCKLSFRRVLNVTGMAKGFRNEGDGSLYPVRSKLTDPVWIQLLPDIDALPFWLPPLQAQSDQSTPFVLEQIEKPEKDKNYNGKISLKLGTADARDKLTAGVQYALHRGFEHWLLFTEPSIDVRGRETESYFAVGRLPDGKEEKLDEWWPMAYSVAHKPKSLRVRLLTVQLRRINTVVLPLVSKTDSAPKTPKDLRNLELNLWRGLFRSSATGGSQDEESLGRIVGISGAYEAWKDPENPD